MRFGLVAMIATQIGLSDEGVFSTTRGADSAESSEIRPQPSPPPLEEAADAGSVGGFQ